MSETWADQLDTGTGLIQLMTLVQGIYATVSERHELTPVQAKLLCVLIGGPRGMAELAHLFGVEKAALTGLVDADIGDALGRLTDAIPSGDREQFRSTVEGIILRCRTSPSSE
ncbi:hypothetical protein ACXJJ3_10510 [Kribbella sp. WER1]